MRSMILIGKGLKARSFSSFLFVGVLRGLLMDKVSPFYFDFIDDSIIYNISQISAHAKSFRSGRGIPTSGLFYFTLKVP